MTINYDYDYILTTNWTPYWVYHSNQIRLRPALFLWTSGGGSPNAKGRKVGSSPNLMYNNAKYA